MYIKRIIANLLLKDGWVVQSIGFEKFLPIGRPEIAVKFLNAWDIDEIVLLDISATSHHRAIAEADITKCADLCTIPFAVGGGLSSVDQMANAIRNGAEKVVLNSRAVSNPDLIDAGAKRLGSQCIVISIDAKQNAGGEYEIFTHGGKQATGRDPIDWACEAQERGAGEILLNSIDRDGGKAGYDLDLIQSCAESVHIPLIACGGVGNPGHLVDAMNHTSADGFAVGNVFHFVEHSVSVAKEFVRRKNIGTRHGVEITYMDHGIAPDQRPQSKQFSFRRDHD